MKRIVIEHGEIIQTTGDRARVKLPRNDSCRACGLCLFGADKRGMILEVKNTIGAVPGDRVQVEIPRRDPLAAGLLLFGLPLLGLLAGAGAGYALAGPGGWDPDGGAVLLGALFLAGTFLLLRRLDRRRRKGTKGKIRIIRVVPSPPPPA